MRSRWMATAGAATLAAMGAVAWTAAGSEPREAAPTQAAASASATSEPGVRVELCDGETAITVAQNTPATREQGQEIADELMAQWKRANPEKDWVEQVKERHMIVPPADNSHLLQSEQDGTYIEVTERDLAVWENELERFVVDGARIFHDAEALGSTIAVSCDMCHPDASNTHPETYPKYQTQLGRVVLLRDMINWCIEHPVRGERLAEDDPRMRALEAYIYAQRKGTALEYGKH